jgi:hypothetical protein
MVKKKSYIIKNADQLLDVVNKTQKKMKEQDIVNAIVEYLNYAGHFCWRNNTGAFKTQKGMYWFGRKGSSDILGVHKNGRFIAIEVKIGSNKPTIAQDSFLKEVSNRGGYSLVAYGLNDVVKYFQNEGSAKK